MNCKTRKSVRFHPDVLVQEVENQRDMSESEMQCVWYSRAEYRRIRDDFSNTILKMHPNNPFGGMLDPNEHCMRGLEHKTSEGSKMRRTQKSGAMRAVLKEQAKQRRNRPTQNDYYNLIVMMRDISVTYKSKCASSSIQARKKGVQDELEAKLIHDGIDETTSPRTAPTRPRRHFVQHKTLCREGMAQRRKKQLFSVQQHGF